MPAPKELISLVERFRLNLEDYQAGKYNETQVRLEFIDPYFEALGWDVHNKKGYAEPYKDVVHEDQVKVSGATKAPDYGFRIGGNRKFFVEAKKPSISIKDDIHPAYQLRRYAWSAKLPLSILTDFEEMAVYDCRVKPVKTDKSSTARVMYFTFDEYSEKWDEIAEIFSREAVLQGSFDRYAESSKRKRGTAEVDVAFLAEIEHWRESLARNIALRNPGLTVRDLNFAVQRTIDRIIFLRIAEDRGLEPYGRLQNLADQSGAYLELCQLYHRADERYNSGLFHFKDERGRKGKPDEFTINLNIDDKVIQYILRNLYYPDSPYEFSVLPADILGQVYEQFLGKVIRLTKSGKAKVEDKPEVKKAGGVYYTPNYIVDYIVEHTVGKLLEGKTPKEASQLRICDPACGSGSFLLGAYQYLLNWHREFYVSEDPEKYTRAARGRIQALYQGPYGEWRLTTAEKRRILLNNIYGVDIDPQAVEVTKLSLLLKVLEGENEGSLGQQLVFFQERALPDLEENIKCGNSLIGPDYYIQQGQQLDIFDNEEIYHINAFDWVVEFSEIMKNGGFNAVIGNPPWGAKFSNKEKTYYRDKYGEVHVRTPESFNYFIGKMWHLTKFNGLVGVIAPSSFLNQHEFWKTRRLLVKTSMFSRICNLGDNVFQGVTAPSCILVFGKKEIVQQGKYYDYREIDRTILAKAIFKENNGLDTSKAGLLSESYLLNLGPGVEIALKCQDWPKLRAVAEDVATGISSGLDSAYVYEADDIERSGLEEELLRKLVIGREINRYIITPTSGKQIIYITPEHNIEDYPITKNTLLPFRERLMKRREAAQGKIPWYSLNWPRRRKLFNEPKLVIRQTADRILAAFDDNQWFCLKSVIIVQLPYGSEIQYQYLLALLNSRLIHFLYDYLVGEKARVFPEVKPVKLFQLPIRTINFSDPSDVNQYNILVSLVESMQGLHSSLIATKSPSDKQMLQRQIETTDKQIDAVFYELYGLTDEEIKIVEESLVS